MDLAAYETETLIEASHWWYVGRRRLFLQSMRDLRLPLGISILDIGTSTGTNLRMLRDAGFTNVRGLDISPVAAQYCASKGLGPVEIGDICALPFDDNSFDFILATDIVEHVDNDTRAMAEIARVLKPSAHALLTVPAFPSLWSSHDVFYHHKRRYMKPAFETLVASTGLETGRSYYFNYLLFVPIVLTRMILKRIRPRSDKSELGLNNGFSNSLLNFVFMLDVSTAKLIKPPFGVSILCLASKPGGGLPRQHEMPTLHEEG